MNEMRKKPAANEMCSIRFQVFVLLPCDQGPVWLSADKPLLSMLPPHRPACLWCVHKCFFQNHLVLQVMLTYDSVIVMQFVAVGRCACTQAVWLSADWQLIRVRTEVCCHSLPFRVVWHLSEVFQELKWSLMHADRQLSTHKDVHSWLYDKKGHI